MCLIEKGSKIGAHILSGNVFIPDGLTELFPNWKELGVISRVSFVVVGSSNYSGDRGPIPYNV